MVEDSSLETINVMDIPSMMNAARKIPDINEPPLEMPAVKNISIIVISMGKRPLQGTKLLVKMAISLSRGDSIILHPVMPHALQPNPIHMVRACLPWAPHLLKALSKLNATRGR